ncbi:CPBP family intramembrane metalloprotease [Hyunsoonleella flava]|uniref:CPBP family intramembrane metalloprotease n=1 Tax=Hyunsoonleella flava TaxID=2527939 RepID=A0A4Q9FAG5_9FLAO|nr:CPBP family intramembrane glutamic endopeptidase [Hyunsoonleella flava]TBN00853.1 CPBP family intramembrane metalloprotease [Hyunsoonleella flava]
MKPKLTTDLIKFSKTTLISERRRILEIAVVILTAIGKFVFMDILDWRLPYVVIAVSAWSIYIYHRYSKEKNILRYWGFRTDNFRMAIKLMAPFAVIAVVSFLIIGYCQDTLNLTWHILPLLVTYPIWGSIQQFLTIGLIAGNLNHLKLNKILVVFVTAVLFSVVHYPSKWLMVGTFILALFYGYVYLKVKNIYAMGICHGWLGALFYYTVVNQDPFGDIFLKYFI